MTNSSNGKTIQETIKIVIKSLKDTLMRIWLIFTKARFVSVTIWLFSEGHYWIILKEWLKFHITINVKNMTFQDWNKINWVIADQQNRMSKESSFLAMILWNWVWTSIYIVKMQG